MQTPVGARILTKQLVSHAKTFFPRALMASTSALTLDQAPSTGLVHDSFTREELIARIKELEAENHSLSSLKVKESQDLLNGVSGASVKSEGVKTKSAKALRKAAATTNPSIDGNFFDRYPSRKIALKFSYEGWLYCGLAMQSEDQDTPLPTVEAVLMDALVKARLVKDDWRDRLTLSRDRVESDDDQPGPQDDSKQLSVPDHDNLDYSRCGRTDRGVSAAGQVVSLYVRSQLGEEDGIKEDGWRPAKRPQSRAKSDVDSQALESLTQDERNSLLQRQAAQSKSRTELPYVQLLNRVLPPSIRVSAWSPVHHTFDSRFSCSYRHYKYFFSEIPASPLNIAAMKDAANRLVGEHDFRNLCKVDPTKQISNFRRRIISATLDNVEDSDRGDDLWVLNLKGTAFLYHQVRHIMAILFLVGSGLEPPSIVDCLLNTGYWDPELDRGKTKPDEGTPVVKSRPSYEMADDLPLVLWDCAYPEGAVDWQRDVATFVAQGVAFDKGDVDMYEHYTQHRLKATISKHFHQAYQSYTKAAPVPANLAGRHIVQVGASRTLNSGKHIPLLTRPRSELVENINRKWLEGQGRRRAERKAAKQSHQ